MRVIFAVLCDSFTRRPDQTGYDIQGVKEGIRMVGTYYGTDAPPPVAFSTKLILSLYGGTPGAHQGMLSIRYEVDGRTMPAKPFPLDWPQEALGKFLEININGHLFGPGLYEISILMDGEPLHSIPLLVSYDDVRRTDR